MVRGRDEVESTHFNKFLAMPDEPPRNRSQLLEQVPDGSCKDLRGQAWWPFPKKDLFILFAQSAHEPGSAHEYRLR